jgi:DNA-binding CsgD family transcriptional regulator/tetratricopeptide (TPR) repeat protein
LIGREPELAALAGLARRAAAGEGAFVLVCGDAGVGKTRLLAELRVRLPAGMLAFRGICLEYAPSPMGPLVEIVSAFQQHASAAGGTALPAPTGDDPVDKRRLFERIAQTLRAGASARPFAAIVDDAHWADTATIELLQFLLQTLADARVLVVVAYRTDELTRAHPLNALIARAARARHAQHIELEPLGQAQVHELIDATLPANLTVPLDTLREVRDRSEGNPLFAEELLKAVVDGARSGHLRSALPLSLHGLLLERLRRLRHDDVRLLEIAALVGRRFDAAFLARIAERDATSLEPFLRLAIDEHYLIEDTDEPGWFTFRHALTRETILSGMLAMQTRAMHLRIAQEIEREADRDTRAAELAEHYWCAARLAQCAGHAERAGDLARARHAYAEAAELYERALACGVADAQRLAALHEKAAAVYVSLGGSRKALEHLEAAAGHHEAVGNVGQLIEVQLDLALALRRTGQTGRALDVLHRAADSSKQSANDRLLLKSAVQLAQLRALAEEWPQVESHLRDAEPLLGAADERDRVRFATSRAALRLAKGDLDGWRDDSDRATSIARSYGDPTLIAFALTNYGVDARKFAQLEAAAACFREAAEIGRSYGTLYTATFARLGYANVLYLTGRLAAARDEMHGVLAELHESTTVRILVAQFGVALATVLRDENLFNRCYAPETLEAAFATGEPIQYAPLAATVAEHHLAAGDDAAAAAMLQRVLGSLPEGWEDCEVLLPIAVCCSRADVERARAHFSQARARTRNPFVDAARELFDAYAAARFGGRDAKLRRAKAAAAAFRQLGMPLLEAEAYELAEQPARAVGVCERIGALRLPRRLAPRSQRRPATMQLTAREREIVQLALRGMPNGAIADELSLSERTVEAHMAAAYRKIGVRSRGELANVLSRPS